MVRLLLMNTAYTLIEAYDGEAGVRKRSRHDRT